MNPYEIIRKYYTEGSELYKILVSHSKLVETKALEIAEKHPELNLDKNFIAESSMLHDIGIFLCNSTSIQCFGTRNYVEHGYLGAEILRKEGYPLHALVCERHTGVGLSIERIISGNLPVPRRDMKPVSPEEIVICYADKFFSKSTLKTQHSLEYITEHLRKYNEADVVVFLEWHYRFR
ncbi:MAG: HDIG domain-containing protein [Paludibacter sp.]|nr:HDIG domain-containing protein [Paludibacter sp.]